MNPATVASHHMLNVQILRMGLQAPQLTRGPVCSCPYIGQTWHDGPMCWEYHQEPDIDCPVHGWMFTDSYLSPCTCAYHKQYTRFTRPASLWARRVQSYSKVTATGFIIDPGCVHHGEARRQP